MMTMFPSATNQNAPFTTFALLTAWSHQVSSAWLNRDAQGCNLVATESDATW